MVAFDLTTIVHNGIIHVDPALNGRQVRVVVLIDDGPVTKADRQALLDGMLARRSKVDVFTPLSRGAAHSLTDGSC